jgi:hypothetical protein
LARAIYSGLARQLVRFTQVWSSTTLKTVYVVLFYPMTLLPPVLGHRITAHWIAPRIADDHEVDDYVDYRP